MRRLLSAVTLMLLCMSSVSAPVMAFDPFGNGACNVPKADQSVACRTTSKDPIAGSDGILLKVTNIVAYIGGAIAVIMIIVGAIRFITAGSDMSTGSRTDTDVEDARRTIVNALLGLVVIILARAILMYVIRRF